MSLTERERQILELRTKGKTDHKIARDLGVAATSIQRSRKNALRKLAAAKQDLQWAQKQGIQL